MAALQNDIKKTAGKNHGGYFPAGQKQVD